MSLEIARRRDELGGLTRKEFDAAFVKGDACYAKALHRLRLVTLEGFHVRLRPGPHNADLWDASGIPSDVDQAFPAFVRLETRLATRMPTFTP
jgi:hypothetical protein